MSPGKRLLALTQEMFECAKTGDWEQLASIEQARRPLFNQVFSNGIIGNEDLAREILFIDEKSMELAAASAPDLQRELLSIRRSSKGNSAYQAVQGYTSVDD